MSLTILKKSLEEKTQQELIREIGELYKRFPVVKEYYQFKMGDITTILEKYKNIIKKEFISNGKNSLPKARMSVAKKAIQDFKKISNDTKLIVDITFTFVECVSNFNNEFGPDGESFYTVPENAFGELLEMLKKNNLLLEYKSRAYNIVANANANANANATDGWGHLDTLTEHYEDFYGDFEK